MRQLGGIILFLFLSFGVMHLSFHLRLLSWFILVPGSLSSSLQSWTLWFGHSELQGRGSISPELIHIFHLLIFVWISIAFGVLIDECEMELSEHCLHLSFSDC